MRALLLDAPGGPETLRVGEADEPVPGPGRVLIRVHACGLNPVDWKVASGGNPDWSWPHILGLDVAGTVEALGEGVTGVAPGQRVALHHDLRRPGGMAELVVVDPVALAPIPDAVSFQDAAALPCAGMTGYQALTRRLHLHAGQSLLVTGIGGVGGYAVQVAARLGVHVIVTASAAKHAEALALGAEHVIDYAGGDVVARVRELTDGRGVDAVLDTVSAASATANLGALAFNGGLAFTNGRPDLTSVPEFTTAPSVHEISLGAAYSSGGPEARADLSAMLGELMALVAEGSLSARIADTLNLGEVPQGYARIKNGHMTGKLVMVDPWA